MFHFRKKEERPVLLEQSRNKSVVYEIPDGSDLEKQLTIIGLTKRDLQIAQVLQPFIREHITEIMDEFYEKVTYHPKLLEIINENSSLERLKKL